MYDFFWKVTSRLCFVVVRVWGFCAMKGRILKEHIGHIVRRAIKILAVNCNHVLVLPRVALIDLEQEYAVTLKMTPPGPF